MGSTPTIEIVLIRVDPGSPAPLYQQIAQQIRGALAAGALVSGERLPPARDLAVALQVNVQTVLRAYAELRDEQLVEVRRGRGVTVLGQPDRAGLADQARRLIEAARDLGLSDPEIHDLVRSHL
jgi:DNA-binding transcriptional regulator YhcF (GntR family)